MRKPSGTGVELPDPPRRGGCDGAAHLLLGVLPHSSRWRGWIAECEDQPHLIEGLHQVAAPPGRGDASGGASTGWPRSVIPDRADHGQLRPGRDALPGRDLDLPEPTRLAQGRGGEERRTRSRSAGGAPWATTSPSPQRRRAGPHLRQVRRPQTPPRRAADHGRRAGRRRTAAR